MNYKTLFENYIRPKFAAADLNKITVFMVNQYISELLESGGKHGSGLSANTVQAVVIVLKSVFKYGETTLDISNPAKNISLPKTDFHEVETFSKAEMERIKNYAVTGNISDLGILLCLYTGMRIGEICSWDSGDITYKFCRVKALNRAVQKQLNGLIALKEEVLSKVLNCQMFTMNYPLLIEHIIREAKLYRKYLHALESDGEINIQSMKDIECFWNQIMMEHALFIRGLLDPSEVDLISSANTFAEDYAVLLKSCHNAQNNSASANSLTETQKFKDFKIAGVKGIEACKIRSIILPLLADHVLREANHFIRILKN